MISKERIKGGRFAVILAAFLLFCKIRPYFFWHGIYADRYFDSIITIVLGLLFYINRKKLDSREELLVALFGIIVVMYPIVSDQNFNVFVSVLPVLFIPFASNIFTKRVFKCFLTIYCVLVGLSLFVWIFAASGIIPPYTSIPPLNPLKPYNYSVWPFLVCSPEKIRFGGLFDEPGVVGTISGLFICANKINFKDWRSWILILSGFSSFSLFFYVLVVVYFGIYYVGKKKKISTVLMYFAVFGAFFILMQTTPVLNEMIGSRLGWNAENKTIVGDNRTADLAWEMFDKIKGTREFWFGIDNYFEFRETIAYSSSFLNVILMNGMLFFGLIVLFYFLYGWRYHLTKTEFLLFCFAVAGTIYQRPGIFHPEYIFLWIYLARQEAIIAYEKC